MDTFASTFRRNRACKRCQRLRVKCSFADPSSQMCLRCLKARQPECIVSDSPNSSGGRLRNNLGQQQSPGGGPMGGGVSKHFSSGVGGGNSSASSSGGGGNNKTSNSNAGITFINHDIASIQNRDSRKAELEKLIHTSQTELNSLGGASQPEEDRYTRFNCVITAIELGFFTAQQAQEIYEKYQANWSASALVECDRSLSLDEHANKEPLTALAMIVVTQLHSNIEGADKMVRFLQGMIGSRLFLLGQHGPDIVKSLSILNSYVHGVCETHPMMYLLSASNAITGMYMTGLWDLQTVETETDLTRARLFLGAYCNLATLANNSGQKRFYDVLPLEPALLDAVENKAGACSSFDNLVVYRIRILLAAKEAIEELEKCQEYPEISHVVGSRRARLSEYRSTAERLELETTSPVDGKLRTSKMWEDMVVIPVLEAAMTRLVLYNDLQPEHFRYIGLEIVAVCEELIVLFETAVRTTDLLSKHVFFRPLQALTSMCRVRMIFSAFRVDDAVDVEKAFADVKGLFESIVYTNAAANKAFVFLIKIEKWMKMYEMADEPDMTLSTAALLYRVLHDKPQPSKGGGAGGGSTKGSTGGSASSFEQLLQELFLELF